MKRLPIALLPWMVLATAAHGQTRSADVLYTHFDDVPTRALRVGDEAFVTSDDVQRWGWTVNVWADMADIKAEGRTASVPMRILAGKQVFPLRAAIKKLGGGADWVNNTDTLAIYGTVTAIQVRGGKVKIDAGFGFQPRASVLTEPFRLVLDMSGVRLDAQTKLDLGNGARVVQYRPNVARLIVETPALVDLTKLSTSATTSLSLDYPTEAAPPIVRPVKTPDKQADVPPVTPPPDTNPPDEDGGATAPTTPVIVPLDIRVASETESELRLDIPIATPAAPIFQKPDVNTLEIVLPGTFRDLPTDFSLDTQSISSVTTRTIAAGKVIVLTLARPMGAQLSRDAKGIHIQLSKPDVGDGRLAGKLIVVDPGHGGKDTGASGGGIREKDLNLAMGNLIADELAKAGATVISTRKTDVFIELEDRAAMAQKAHADLFISSHINTTDESSGTSGTITFYHEARGASKVLAECIQQEIAKVNQLPNLGVWSDRRIYRSGFAVLRQTTMPGVLLELGFINNAKDRKRLVTDEFQHSVAKAVVQGIKVFLGDAQKND